MLRGSHAPSYRPNRDRKVRKRFTMFSLLATLPILAQAWLLEGEGGGTGTVTLPDAPEENANLETLRTQLAEVNRQSAEVLGGLQPGQVPNAETNETLSRLDRQTQAWEGAIRSAEEGLSRVDRLRNAQEAQTRRQHDQRPAMYGNGGDERHDVIRVGEQEIPRYGVTPGDRWVESEQNQRWNKLFPSGGPADSTVTVRSDVVEMPDFRNFLGLRAASDRLRGEIITPDRMRALMHVGTPPAEIASTSPSAGALVAPDYRGLLEPGLLRPLRIRQLLTTIPVQGEAIQWVREKSRVHGAAMTPEATALTGTSGTKPEGGIVFELHTTTIGTIAEWVPATKRILSDAAFLRGYIDEYLTYDLALTLEDQIVTGDGVGDNFLGILNDPGIQHLDHTSAAITGLPASAGTVNMLDYLRVAKRLVRVNARTDANAIVVNPEDGEKIDILKAQTAGIYLGANPYAFGVGNSAMWGLPLIESEAVPAGTAIVADWRRAILFDREQTTISVGTANDDFIRNLLRVLAEARFGLGVLRPLGFCAVTFPS